MSLLESSTLPLVMRRHGPRLVFCLALFALFFALYSYTQRQTSGFIYWFDDWIFYADSAGSYSHMKKISFQGNMWRHPIYPLVVHPLFVTARKTLRLGARDAARVIISFFAALNVSLFYLLVRRTVRERGTAIPFALLYGFLFSNLVFFSLPETYALASIGILSFFLLSVRFSSGHSPRHAIYLGLASGVGALINPPLGLLLLPTYVLLMKGRGVRKSLSLMVWATTTALLIYLGTNFLLFGPGYVEKSQSLTHKWATASNFLHLKNWLNVWVSFFIFSVISPFTELRRSIGLKDFVKYFYSPMAFSAFFAFALYLGYGVVRLYRQGMDVLILMSMTWLGALFLFHVYFNPKEALLYSSQAMVPLMLILARVFEGLRWKWKWAPLVLFTANLVYVNLRCMQG